MFTLILSLTRSTTRPSLDILSTHFAKQFTLSRTQVLAGGKVAPIAPEDNQLASHLMAGAPSKAGQSSPDVVVDVGGGINVDADELSDRVWMQNAGLLTASPAIPAPTESPLVGSPDTGALLGGQVAHHDGVPGPEARRVSIGGVRAAPVAWGPVDDESPSPSPTRKPKSSKKKSKDKDKHKSEEPDTGAPAPTLIESQHGGTIQWQRN